MKVIINLLKFILITILTICIITLGIILVAFSTILDKNFIIQKMEENNFYAETYELVKENFEKYIHQSGLEEEVLDNICTEEKVENDINIMISNIYDGTDKEISVTEISDNLNEKIDKLGIKNPQNEQAIQEFVSHICVEYTNTIIHTKYENNINNAYNEITKVINKVYNIALIALVVDIVLLIIINNKKISKNLQDIGIAIIATSLFELVGNNIINSKVNIAGIKIFNNTFSETIVAILQEILDQIVSLALGTLVLGVIFILAYDLVQSIKNKKSTKEAKKGMEEEIQ